MAGQDGGPSLCSLEALTHWAPSFALLPSSLFHCPSFGVFLWSSSIVSR